MAPFSHTSSHHSPSPHPLTIPPHLFLHHPSLPLLITPVTSINTTPPYPTTPHYSPHYIPSLLPSLPLLTTLLTTPLLTLLWLITYLPHHTPSPPSSPLTTTYHPLKGRHNTKRLVKSHFPMPLNLCRTFLSLKTSFLIIFCKKNFWDKIDQKLEYDGGGGAHVLNCARATSSIHFSTCNILPPKKTLISHFQVLLV